MSTITREQLIEYLKASTQNSSGMFEIGEETICALMSLLTATPAPVSVPDERYQHLSELYHAQEKRLFKLAQRIKGSSFDKYAYSPSQAIDVLESAIFGEREDDCRAAMLQGAAGNSPAIPDRWIPVSERMPEKGQKVFYYFDIVGVHAGYYDGDNTFVNENGGGWLTGDVTHWMEWNMPAAPNREVK